MVSNARLDLPDPETPVTTVIAFCGISKLMFFRLWTRAPVTTMDDSPPAPGAPSTVASRGRSGALVPARELGCAAATVLFIRTGPYGEFPDVALKLKLYVGGARAAN